MTKPKLLKTTEKKLVEEKKPEEPDASVEGPAEEEANKPPKAELKAEASGEPSAASPAQAPPTEDVSPRNGTLPSDRVSQALEIPVEPEPEPGGSRCYSFSMQTFSVGLLK